MERVENISTIICGRCATVCDDVDNFCKCCGMALTDEQLPLKREQQFPDVWRPQVPAAVVRAVAVVAVGTLTEIMARRLAREAGRRVTNVVRLPLRGDRARETELADEPNVISDTVFIRRVRAVGRRAR